MTEIINNRQQRIEIMKSLVRQLHDGSGEEKIRKQLETMLDEADYSDVFVMEVQLIEEGIPEESILELCDTHTRVLSSHLDLQETPQTNPGHPVHTFVEENKELTKLTQRIRLLIKKVDHAQVSELLKATTAVMKKLPARIEEVSPGDIRTIVGSVKNLTAEAERVMRKLDGGSGFKIVV